MASFHSNDEFFQAVVGLLARLEGGGHSQAAAELKKGFGCLNGLTDGCALFLESIQKVEAAYGRSFAPEERKDLKEIRKAMHRAVYRPRG